MNDGARFLFSARGVGRRWHRFGRMAAVGVEIETIFSCDHEQFQAEVQNRPDDQDGPSTTLERTIAGHFRDPHRPDLVIAERHRVTTGDMRPCMTPLPNPTRTTTDARG